VHFVTKVSLVFLNQPKKYRFFMPTVYWPILRGKFLTLYSESLTFLAPKTQFSQETAQNKEKCIL
jgi:hypothetical protein